MNEDQIKDFLQLSPIYDRLSDEDKKALVEDMKMRYFYTREPESNSFESYPKKNS